MGRIELPENPGAVLEDPNNLTPETFEAVLQRWEAAQFDPPMALRWAETAIELAQGTGMVMLARAQSARGYSLTCRGCYETAESCFLEASELLVRHPNPFAEAEFLLRWAGLRANQGWLDEADGMLDRALDASEKSNSAHLHGEILVGRGIIWAERGDYDRSVQYLSDGLHFIDFQLSDNDFYGAVHNLAVAMVKAYDPGRFGRVFDALKAARKALPPNSDAARTKLKWIEGLAYIRLGNNNRAVPVLSRVYKNLEGTNHERAILSVDLAKAFYEKPSRARACAALAKALDFYKSIEGMNPAVVESVSHCLDGLRHRTGEYDPWDIRDSIAQLVRVVLPNVHNPAEE